eukprot:5951764-Alexandrium_andersonii.AAC.1
MPDAAQFNVVPDAAQFNVLPDVAQFNVMPDAARPERKSSFKAGALSGRIRRTALSVAPPGTRISG